MLDNVRLAMRSLERENKALEKRYREQATSFDSARQSWLDSEQQYVPLSPVHSAARHELDRWTVQLQDENQEPRC